MIIFEICIVTPLLFFSPEGNQYTYQGNEHYSKHKSDDAVATTVNNAIENQEMGKSPIEYTN